MKEMEVVGDVEDMEDMEEYRYDENDTYLSLRPRIIDFREEGFNLIPWITVESLILREDNFKDYVNFFTENRYTRGYAFDLEVINNETDEKQVGVIEGEFFDFDKMKAEGIPLRHLHYCPNVTHVKIFKILQNQDASFGRESSLNTFEINKILINEGCREQNIGTAAMLALTDAIEYHFNRKVGILLAHPEYILPDIHSRGNFMDHDEEEIKRLDAEAEAENLLIRKDRERLKEFFLGLGFRQITKNGYLYIDTRQEMADATENRCVNK